MIYFTLFLFLSRSIIVQQQKKKINKNTTNNYLEEVIISKRKAGMQHQQPNKQLVGSIFLQVILYI